MRTAPDLDGDPGRPGDLDSLGARFTGEDTARDALANFQLAGQAQGGELGSARLELRDHANDACPSELLPS
jgi:hypothetical protein